MMDFSFSEEQQEIWDLLTKVAIERLRPKAFERRFTMERPADNLRLLGELGILGIALPKEVGGEGRPEADAILALERIAWGCPLTGEFALGSAAGPSIFIAKWGSDYQKQTFLPSVINGSASCAISLTEPEAGSALTDLRTAAKIHGDVCVINGQKTFCSMAGDSEWILVFVRFGEGTDGIGAVIVDKNAPGFTVGVQRRHMSGASWHDLIFNNTEVPVQNILFDSGGFRKLMSSYSMERCAGAAWALGVAQIAMDMAVEYANSRKQFGRPISDFQFVQGPLADMYIRLESARLMLYRAVVGADRGLPTRLESSAAKVVATEAAVFVTDRAMQIHGGGGMSEDLPLEWLYRYVRPLLVASGTSDIHRSMIASEVLGRRLDHRAGRTEVLRGLARMALASDFKPMAQAGARTLPVGSGEAPVSDRWEI
jgi:alkylation response protein AidB-like acyl-CoA dehydrogenase